MTNGDLSIKAKCGFEATVVWAASHVIHWRTRHCQT